MVEGGPRVISSFLSNRGPCGSDSLPAVARACAANCVIATLSPQFVLEEGAVRLLAKGAKGPHDKGVEVLRLADVRYITVGADLVIVGNPRN